MGFLTLPVQTLIQGGSREDRTRIGLATRQRRPRKTAAAAADAAGALPSRGERGDPRVGAKSPDFFVIYLPQTSIDSYPVPWPRARQRLSMSAIIRLAKSRPVAFGAGYSLLKTTGCDLMVQKVVEKRENIDWKRTAAFGSFGLFYLGGVQYALYVPVFSRLFPNAAAFAGKTVAQKLGDFKGIRDLFSQVPAWRVCGVRCAGVRACGARAVRSRSLLRQARGCPVPAHRAEVVCAVHAQQ